MTILTIKIDQRSKKAEENIKTRNTTTLNPNDVWRSLGLK